MIATPSANGEKDVSSVERRNDRRMPNRIRVGILVGLLLAAQVEDLVTGAHMLRRFGTVVEWGLVAGPVYTEYGVLGLAALKVGLLALVLGAAFLLLRVGHPKMYRVAIGLLFLGSLAGVLGAASNLRWVLRA
jgi:hypothetical protein